MGTKGPFASLKQKLIKNGLFLQSVRQDGGEMIQISHARHVNVQEHPGVNSLAARQRCSPGWLLGTGAGDCGCAASSQPCSHSPGQGRARTWAGTSPELWLLEHTCTECANASAMASPPRPSSAPWHWAQGATSTARLSWNITQSMAAIFTLILYFLFSPLANKVVSGKSQRYLGS